MSNNKHLTDLFKVCSVLPALLIMPAMASALDSQLVIDSSETLKLSNMNVSGMAADTNGGAIVSAGVLSVSDAEFIGNSSKGYGGVAYLRNDDGTTSLNISGTKLSTNSASIGGALFGHTNASITLNNTDFEYNTAEFGGAVYTATSSGVFTMNGGKVNANTAWSAGGLDLFATSFLNDVTFTNNKATNADDDGAGALFLGSVSKTYITDSEFRGNTSAAVGGAIAMRSADEGNNSKAKLDIFDSEFINNHADTNGGAIYSTFYDSATVKDSVYIYDTDFTLNSANNGGAIYTEGLPDLGSGLASMKIVDADFDGNTATNFGGAIYNGGNLILSDGDFENNEAGDGGAIFNKGVLTVNGGSEFIRNTAELAGGAIYNGLNATIDVLSADFKSNSVMCDNGGHASGGAIYNGGKLGDVVGVFNDNKSTATGDSYTAKGGAIYSWADKSAHATIDSIVADFNGNSANSMGTYGFAMGGAVVNDGVLGKLYAANTGFVNNTSNAGYVAYAGAFYNSEYAHVSELVADFVGNSADATFFAVGGALANKGKIDYLSGTFSNNILKNAQYSQGGAIFNGSNPDDDSLPLPEITIVDSVFANNVIDAADADWAEGGAIYNELNSFVTMKGTNTFTGNTVNGKANDIYNDGTLTIASGMTSIDGGINGAGALDIQSDATLNMNYASIEQGTINIDGTLMASLANANDTVDISGIMSGSGDIVLTAATTGTYDISVFNDFIADRDADDVISFGKTYNVSIADGMATLTAKSASDIASSTGITNSAAGVISTFATSSDAKIQQVSLAIQEALNNGNTELVEKELGKLNPDSKPVTQSVAASVQGQVLTVASGRMSSVGGGATGRAGGDVTSAGVWAQGLINKSKLNGQFDGHTRGFALGADTLIDDVYTIGAGYAYNNTDIDTKNGDTSVESNSVFAYAQYKPANWYINATMNYTMSEYTDETNVMGYALDNQYDADAFGIQAMYGYDFASGITPELGMRYLHVSQDAHQNAGGNMIAEMNTNFLSVVSGVNYAFNIESDSEVKFSPSLRAAMTYDVISENAIATVMVPGSSAYFVDVENLSRLGGEFGIGLTAEWRGLEMSLNYELDLHEDYTSQTGLLKFRYDF